MVHRIGIIGFGGMAGWHYNTISKIDQLEVAGIWDTDESRRGFAQKKNIHVYHSQEELLTDEKTDLVLIATPNDVHKSIAIAAMEAGKNVISEKPITLSSADLKEMMDVSDRTGKFLTVHQNRRWDEDFRTIEKIINEGKLGEIYRIESRVHGSRGIPGDWRQEKEHGGGMILDWGVHLLDQALLIFPGVKLKKVYATITNVTNKLVDDGFTADLEFENGVHMIVEVGTSNFISLPRWYVLGQNGSAVIDGWKKPVRIVRATGVNEEDVVPVITAAGLTKTMAPRREDSIMEEEYPEVSCNILEFYENVIAVLEGTEESRIRLEEVMRVMRLMETILKSAQCREVVSFE